MNEVRPILDNRKDLQKYLFCRGFLIADQELDTEQYPFYGNWDKTDLGFGYKAYVHNLQNLATFRTESESFVLIGNAYNPYTMEYREEDLLRHLSTASDRIEYINELTGVFFLGICKLFHSETISFSYKGCRGCDIKCTLVDSIVCNRHIGIIYCTEDSVT